MYEIVPSQQLLTLNYKWRGRDKAPTLAWSLGTHLQYTALPNSLNIQALPHQQPRVQAAPPTRHLLPAWPRSGVRLLKFNPHFFSGMGHTPPGASNPWGPSLPCHISLGSLALNTCAISSSLSPDQVWPLKAEVVSSSAAQGEGIIPLVLHGEAGWQNQPTSLWKNAASYTNRAVNTNRSEMPLTISWQALKASKYEPNNLDVRGPSNKNIHKLETTWKDILTRRCGGIFWKACSA